MGDETDGRLVSFHSQKGLFSESEGRCRLRAETSNKQKSVNALREDETAHPTQPPLLVMRETVSEWEPRTDDLEQRSRGLNDCIDECKRVSSCR